MQTSSLVSGKANLPHHPHQTYLSTVYQPSREQKRDLIHHRIHVHTQGKGEERDIQKKTILFNRAARLWLALTDNLPEQRLERCYIVVLEHPDIRTTSRAPKRIDA